MGLCNSEENGLGAVCVEEGDTLLERRSPRNTKRLAQSSDQGQFRNAVNAIKVEDDGSAKDILRNLQLYPPNSNTPVRDKDQHNASDLTERDQYDSEAEAEVALTAVKQESRLASVESKPHKQSRSCVESADGWDGPCRVKRTNRSETPAPRAPKRLKREPASPLSISSPSETVSACATEEEDPTTFHSCADNAIRQVDDGNDHSYNTVGAGASSEPVDESQAHGNTNSAQSSSGNGGVGGAGGCGDGGGGGGGGNNYNRSSVLPPNKKGKDEPRFACPYQAYEPLRGCLKPARNNPDGGCDGIKRLKQHLCRKHIVSFRCQQCWKSFDSRRKAEEHPYSQPTQCRQRERPDNDMFMSEEDERELTKLSHSGRSEEETWWVLFTLLIPDMRGLDVITLRQMYYPYYLRPRVVSDLPMVSMGTQLVDQGNGLASFNGFGFLQSSSQQTAVVPILPDPLPSLTAEEQVALDEHHNGTSTIQILSWDYSAGSDSTDNNINNNNGNDNDNDSNNIDAMMMIPPFSSQLTTATTMITNSNTSQFPSFTTTSSSFSTSQRESVTQRSYDRLQTRYTELEIVNGCLRAVVDESLERARRAEAILEDVLRSCELPRHLCDKLAEAVDVLAHSTTADNGNG